MTKERKITLKVPEGLYQAIVECRNMSAHTSDEQTIIKLVYAQLRELGYV